MLFAIFGANPLPRGAVTVVLAGWIALAVLFALFKRQTDRPPLAVVLAAPMFVTLGLIGWMLFRLGGSPAEGYGREKLMLFVVGNLAFMIGGLFVGWRRKHLRILLLLILAVSIAGAAVLVFEFVSGGAKTVLPDRFSISPEDDPISLGRESANGLLIGVYLLLAGRAAASRVWVIALLPVLAIALVAAGSRGPVVGVIAGLLIFAAFAVTTPAARRRLLLVAAAAVACVIVVPLVVPDAAISRSLSVFAVSGGDLSSNGRTGLWGLALDTFAQDTFLGIGTGGFAAIQVAEQYPHNILLEAAVELGIVGLILVSWLLADVAVRLVRAWRVSASDDRLAAAVVLALFGTGVVNALFSAGFQDNRVVWLWAGVGAGLSARLVGEARAQRAASSAPLLTRPAW